VTGMSIHTNDPESMFSLNEIWILKHADAISVALVDLNQQSSIPRQLSERAVGDR
jgi:hypothetical protein